MDLKDLFISLNAQIYPSLAGREDGGCAGNLIWRLWHFLNTVIDFRLSLRLQFFLMVKQVNRFEMPYRLRSGLKTVPTP